MCTDFVPVLTALTALFSGVCAGASFWLARKIYREAKEDERLIFGPLDYPYLTVREPDHRNAVIGCVVFNRARRKAFIKKVVAFDPIQGEVEITWSDSIDNLGNPGEPQALIGIVDSSKMYVRRIDGESIICARLEVTHSFSDSPCELIFDPVGDMF